MSWQNVDPDDVPGQQMAVGIIQAFAELVHSVSDEKWNEAASIEMQPCGVPGCTCHVIIPKLMKQLTGPRTMIIKAIKQAPRNRFSN